MAAAFHYAGLEAWDVTVSDLLQGRTHLSDFRGLVFVGGFSYADVLDSGKVRSIYLLEYYERSLNFPSQQIPHLR